MPATHLIPTSVRQVPGSRALLLTFVFVMAAAPALANTYYVSNTGSDSNPGTQAQPWATLAKANATLVAGDVCRIANGTYADPIQPANNGAAGARISYVGNLANPAAVSVASIYVNKTWVSVKGAAATTDFQFYWSSETAKAWQDSVAYCWLPGLTIWGAQDCVIARNVISGKAAILDNFGYAGPPDPYVAAPARDTIRANVLTTTIDDKGFALRGDAQFCLVDSNTFNLNFAVAHGGDCQGRYLYNAYNNTFRDNRWNIEADGELAGAQFTGFALRDSSSYNLFERDSMYCGVQNNYDIGGRLVNSGNAAWVHQCIGNHWKNCVFRTTGYVFTQDLLNGATIENCVFASNHNYPLWLLGDVQNTIIRNCTFYAWMSPAMKVEGDIRLGGNQLYSNIFYSDSVAACFSGMPVVFHGWGTGFYEDYNLFYARTAAAGVTASGEAVYWASSACSAVGPGTNWATSSGNDAHSSFGAPQVKNATWANFDGHLNASSSAIGIGQGGVDAGAYPFVPGGGDVTPPAAVANLQVVQRSNVYALLSWSATGDNGNIGTAAAYDLRYSTQPITAANFSSATSVGTQPPVLPAGSAQSYALTGLTASTTYYFAIKAGDAAGNWSAVSNVPTTTTTATDQLAPAPVGDLR
jgi:hypothetical protein